MYVFLLRRNLVISIYPTHADTFKTLWISYSEFIVISTVLTLILLRLYGFFVAYFSSFYHPLDIAFPVVFSY